jgi:hypothetical protein
MLCQLPPREEVLMQMERDVIYRFHLTGSRYFGTHTKDSDYDFFIENDDGLETWLKDHGFNLISKPYVNANTIVVYRHPMGIDVQIVLDADRHFKVQKALDETGVMGLLKDKSVISRLWKTLLIMYHGP